MISMEKKTIVITGSTRGIGLGLAKEFLSLGHRLLINGRSKDAVNRTVDKLNLNFSDVIGVAGSVTDVNTHHEIINAAVHSFKTVDIWINNAGVPQAHESFSDLETCQIKQVVDVNISGSLIGTRIAAEFMKGQGYGRILGMVLTK